MMGVLDDQGRLFGKVSLIDLMVACFVVSLSPLVYFGYGSVVGHWSLTIEEVRPSRVTAGVEESMTILGSGFDASSTVEIGQHQAADVRFVNAAQLEVSIPDMVEPGIQRVLVRNGRGRMALQQEGIDVVWQPIVTRAELRRSVLDEGEPGVLDIRGRYFQYDSTVQLGPVKLEGVSYVGPTQLMVTVPADQPDLVERGLTVTNPGGAQGVFRDIVEILLPTLEESVPVLIICAFPAESWKEMDGIRRGAFGLDADGDIVAKVIDVISKELINTLPTNTEGVLGIARVWGEGVVVASVVVEGQVEVVEGKVAYVFQNRRLRVGTSIGLHAPSMSATGVVLSLPMPLGDAGWELLRG